MSGQDNSTRFLRWAAAAFAIGFAIHGLDHLRRGMSASPPSIMVAGMVLPTLFPGYQDSFISPPHINVTWFSWFSAITEVGTAIVVGFAGIQATKEQHAVKGKADVGNPVL
jgi:hypothetical protein